MHVISTVAEMQSIARDARAQQASIGCVPTMGALHEGHASLIAASARSHPLTFVSVFVNPTQFGPNEDFDTYPRTLDNDIQMIRDHGGTHVFAPSVAEMYPDGFSTNIRISGITEILEGAHRPGHFDGVSTVVTKLFEAMRPDEAYFGQKDYQQTLVVKRLVRDLFLPVRINVQPTVREDDGLAMSSRNRYLSAEERERSLVLYNALAAGKALIDGASESLTAESIERELKETLATVPAFDVEYAVAAEAESLTRQSTFVTGDQVVMLIAGKIGSTRLIDNMLATV